MQLAYGNLASILLYTKLHSNNNRSDHTTKETAQTFYLTLLVERPATYSVANHPLQTFLFIQLSSNQKQNGCNHGCNPAKASNIDNRILIWPQKEKLHIE